MMNSSIFSKRLRKARNIMKRQNVDSLLITSRNDIYYYTGALIPQEESAMLLIAEGRPKLFISPLLALKKSPDFEVLPVQNIRQVRNLIPSGRIGFDEYDITFKTLKSLKKPSTKWVEFSEKIKEPRMIKDEWEIRMIKKSISITTNALRGIGFYEKTEQEVARNIEIGFISQGAERAFPTIVASGRNSAYIHYMPSNKRIGKGLLIIDCGARFFGYCSDVSRTMNVGNEKREQNVLEDARNIQESIISHAREGVRFGELQEIYERKMKKAGYGVFHSFGHGVGLDVHERPYKNDILKKNMVITVEPGIYIKGLGGTRIEDMLLIRKGNPKILSKALRL